MNRLNRLRRVAPWAVLCAAVLAVPVLVLVSQTGAQDPSKDKRAALMKLKLDHAKGALEGLTLNKMDRVEEHARELKLISAAAEWEPLVVPGPEYLEYTREFQRIMDEMAAHAEEENLDGATLAYVRMTVNCVECHKLMRDDDR